MTGVFPKSLFEKPAQEASSTPSRVLIEPASKMKFLLEDCVTIWSNIQYEEEQLRMKRRWLMGLPSTSKSDTKQLKTPKFLLESLLREDDVSYEIVRTSVERGFGIPSREREHYVVQDYLHLFDTNKPLSDAISVLPSILENMNNTGLFRLANIATVSSVMLEKTRWKIKKFIKEYVLKILQNPNHNDHMRLLTYFPELLKDPRNFRETRVKLLNSTLISHRCAAKKLLEGLEDMPSQTLNAMRRKLSGVQGDTPQLHPAKSVWARDRLLKFFRRKCTSMLSNVKEGDELQKPLAKAMAVAVLSLKLTMKNPNIPMPDFYRFSPEIQGLQNEILKAIWFLKEMNIRSLEVKDLRRLLDPKVEIPNSHFLLAIQRMLTEYLFECSEMVIIPNPLLETTAIITRSCSPNVAAIHFSKEDIEEEVEIVLSVSSQMKQIVWDWISDHDIDEEFADAYMEDILESDDDDDQLLEPQIGESISSDESIGEWRPDDYVLSATASDGNDSSLPTISKRNLESNSPEGSELEQIIFPDSGNPDFGSSSSSYQESRVPHEPQNTSGNKYLAIQEISDETSLVAHQLIGHLLDKFLHIENIDIEESKRSYLRGGLSSPGDCAVSKGMKTSGVDMSGPVLVKVVEELLPNFPKSGIETVKEFMGLPP